MYSTYMNVILEANKHLRTTFGPSSITRCSLSGVEKRCSQYGIYSVQYSTVQYIHGPASHEEADPDAGFTVNRKGWHWQVTPEPSTIHHEGWRCCLWSMHELSRARIEPAPRGCHYCIEPCFF